MKTRASVRFFSHACMGIETDSSLLLSDPWFFGDVFNNSWSLLVCPDLEFLDFSKLEYIWVSHEHPDHLHFPTLKFIRSKTSRPITLIYRKQANPNVREAVESLGFRFAELEAGKLSEFGHFQITSFPAHEDNAAIIKAADLTILNQNDCQLDKTQVGAIQKSFPHIDLWMFQFSLAGYYANASDHSGLARARESHLGMIKKYATAFRPKCFVPFASFVYFSKTSNSYLNEYRVRLDDVVRVSGVPTQILWKNDEVLWTPSEYEARNSANIARWEEAFSSPLPIKPLTVVTEELLRASGESFVAASRQWAPSLMLPGPTAFFLTDLKRYCVVNVRSGTIGFCDITPVAAAGALPAEELLFFFKFPWGADTLNITGAFEIYRQFPWRWMMYTKHCQYVYGDQSLWLLKVIPLLGAILKSVKYALSGRSRSLELKQGTQA